MSAIGSYRRIGAVTVGLAALILYTSPSAAQTGTDDAGTAPIADAASVPIESTHSAIAPAPILTDSPAPTPVAAVTAPPAPVATPTAHASMPPAPRDLPAPIGGAWSPQGARAMTVFGGPGRGITLSSGDEFFSLTLRGRVQLRETVVVPTIANGGTITNEINIRTARLVFSGHLLSRQTQYVMQLALAPQDFEAGQPSPIFDAWVAFNQLRDLQVRVGQFFVPFDRARTNSEWGLQFVDRPLIVGEGTLDRDVGIEIGSNNLFGLDRFAYRAGVFGGEGRNRTAAAPGFLYVARAQFMPFGAFDDGVEGDLQRGRRLRVSLGIAGAYNQNTNRQRSTTGNTLVLRGFDYSHAAVDLTAKFRGLYLFGEALVRQADVDQHDGTAMGASVTEYSRSLWGYIAQVGMMVTDQVEVVARWEQSFGIGRTDPALLTTLRTQGNQFGAGLNWYVAGHGFKVQMDYHYLFGEVFDRGRHQIRLQLQASF